MSAFDIGDAEPGERDCVVVSLGGKDFSLTPYAAKALARMAERIELDLHEAFKFSGKSLDLAAHDAKNYGVPYVTGCACAELRALLATYLDAKHKAQEAMWEYDRVLKEAAKP